MFIDEQGKLEERILNFPILRKRPARFSPYFFAVGDNVKRFYIYEEIGIDGLISILSSKAHYGKESSFGLGCFVGNFCHIGPEAKIGKNTIINNGAIVEHEAQIGSHCHLAPRAVISGRSAIGDFVFIGVGATVKDHISICSHVIVGAGATVVKSIVEPGIYVGCPAVKIKPLEEPFCFCEERGITHKKSRNRDKRHCF